MKRKNIVFLISSFFIFQSTLFAARLTIYNGSGVMQHVIVYAGGQIIATYDFKLGKQISSKLTGGQIIAEHDIESGKQMSIDSGFKPFSRLVWGSPLANQPKEIVSPQYEQLYKADIPSSVTMLNGVINLWKNGFYGINFDREGASERKVKSLQGEPFYREFL